MKYRTVGLAAVAAHAYCAEGLAVESNGQLALENRVNTIEARVDPRPRQSITSFGASAAWWPNDLINFPLHVQQNLSHLLYSEDGLHLSSTRYNMGGDGGSSDASRVTTIGSRVESFLLHNGTYDWSRDHAGVTFLKAAAEQYKVPYVTFFINAAPSHIADNGASCGWNMTAAKVSEFADYVKTVLSHWTDQGIDISYISPMNEPDNNRSNCGQEGMAVDPRLRPAVIKSIREALDHSSAKKVDIIADETSQVTTQAFPEDPLWLPQSAQYMSNIAVHNYDYPNDTSLAEYYQSIQKLTYGRLPPVKFTETCCSTRSGSGSDVFGEQYDPTMQNALIVARYVWQYLTIVQAESFDWWTAVAGLPCSPTVDGMQCATAINNTAGYNSGLISIDGNYNQTHDYNLYLTKRAFLMKHLAHFHRPGSVRYDVPQSQLPDTLNAFVTLSPPAHAGHKHGRRTWNMLLMNHDQQGQEMTVSLPVKHARLVQTVTTSPDVDWQVDGSKSSAKAKNDDCFEVKIPGQSLVTLQFESNA